MDITTQKRNAKKFVEEWKNRGREKQDSQSFWLSLLRDVLGIEKPETFIKFEEKVRLSHDSFIDGYIDQTHVMIEQKGSNKNLDKPIRQSDGSLLTPFQQAQRYSAALPYSKRPRWIVTCNFLEFRVYDMERPNSEPVKLELSELPTNYYQLEFLVDKSNQHLEKEKKVSLSAGELVGRIYDELSKQYKDLNNKHSQRSINQLCVRIVFCLYAEDAGIFGKKNMFHDYLEQFSSREIRRALIRLFKVLDTKEEDRDPYLADDDEQLAAFPYCNGGMFSDENIEIPPFTEELRNLLLRKASDEFDWSEISPTVFGAVFESTLNPETRRKGGMHYTSVENIHKLIDPLFLDDLKNELNEIKKTKQLATLKKKARAFQDKLANLTFFDPAAGSGNFLTETYLQIRKLENETIRLIYGDNQILDTGQASDIIKVSIKQFYGIEINDFAVSVAKTALWIAESQMLEETKDIFYANWDFLPLKTYVNIHEGNALRMDWNSVLPNYACSYLLGNPPFVGQSYRTKEQKQDMIDLFGKGSRETKQDYVICWYKKSLNYALKSKTPNTSIKCAFVSTNSICQGESVPTFWRDLINNGVEIQFARKSFVWTSEAKNKAAVHCVIVGFTFHHVKKEKLLFNDTQILKCNNINPYLIPSENIWINSRPKKPADKEKMTTGSPATDDGQLLLSRAEATDLANKYPLLRKYIKPFVGAREFLHDKGSFSRYCFWFVNAEQDLPEIIKIPGMKERFTRIKEKRLESSATRIQRVADTPWLFAQNRQPKNDYLVIPRHSSERRKYIPIGFMNSNVIAGDATTIVYNATLVDLAILESNVHTAWMKTVAGRLKSDYRYSSSVYYNFPLPKLSTEDKERLAKTGKEILDARKKYPKLSLADMYNDLIMPPELLKAHQDNDRAVMAAYKLPVKTTTESDAVAHLFKMYKKANNE